MDHFCLPEKHVVLDALSIHWPMYFIVIHKKALPNTCEGGHCYTEHMGPTVAVMMIKVILCYTCWSGFQIRLYHGNHSLSLSLSPLPLSLNDP